MHILTDFSAPLTPAPRPADSSAATIVANGLLLLSQQETPMEAENQWTDGALQILPPLHGIYLGRAYYPMARSTNLQTIC